MLEKYFNEIKDIGKRILDGENPLEVIKDSKYKSLVKKIGRVGVFHYVCEDSYEI